MPIVCCIDHVYCSPCFPESLLTFWYKSSLIKVDMQAIELTEGEVVHVKLVVYVARCWCQSFGDASPYVISYYFSSVSVAE